jgi:hypothetical protein
MTYSLPPGALPFIAAVIVFSTVAMANVPVAIWLDSAPEHAKRPEPAREPVPETAAPAGEREVTSGMRTRCAACGVVKSIRRIDAAGDTPESYEFTVRLRDGSIRVSSDASQAKWRAGDNIILIGADERRRPIDL